MAHHRPTTGARRGAGDSRRHNLPAPLTSFVGRMGEMVGLERALAGTRLLTLTGADGSCGFAQTTDEQNSDPLLGPLQVNGGSTDTHALLAGSPAIDAGDSDQIVDQREKTRPKDGDGDGTATDDIGAFEKETAPPPPNTAPKITPLLPDPGSSISDRTPRIRAKISDRETNLRKSDIKLFLDGKKKRGFSYDRSKDRLTYQTGRLERTRHTVKIKATDGQSRSTESWSFRIRKKG